MKLHIKYTPTDAEGKPYNLTANYTVEDLQHLVDDVRSGLAASGQPITAVLSFAITADGTFTVTTDTAIGGWAQ